MAELNLGLANVFFCDVFAVVFVFFFLQFYRNLIARCIIFLILITRVVFIRRWYTLFKDLHLATWLYLVSSSTYGVLLLQQFFCFAGTDW